MPRGSNPGAPTECKRLAIVRVFYILSGRETDLRQFQRDSKSRTAGASPWTQTQAKIEVMDNTGIETKKQTEEVRNLFLFEVGDELYAVDVEFVDRVMKIPPITPIPNSPSAILGIFHSRGKVILAIDIATRMGTPKVKPLSPSFLFVVQIQKDFFAILIDKPKNIVHIPAHEILLAGPLITAHTPPKYIEGVFMHVETPLQKQIKRSFLIVATTSTHVKNEAVKEIKRPVVLLNLKQLLNQEDLQQIFTSQES